MKFRKEFDSLGSIRVPSDKYWGASTQRSNKFFTILLLDNLRYQLNVFILKYI